MCSMCKHETTTMLPSCDNGKPQLSAKWLGDPKQVCP